jgi:hypothetical protein
MNNHVDGEEFFHVLTPSNQQKEFADYMQRVNSLTGSSPHLQE